MVIAVLGMSQTGRHQFFPVSFWDTFLSFEAVVVCINLGSPKLLQEFLHLSRWLGKMFDSTLKL